MSSEIESITYPRRILIRGFLRWLGCLITRLFFEVEISGTENYPTSGPLIVVGNHSAMKEAVLLGIFSPWQIEMLGASDIPHEKLSQIFIALFGYIPVNRGHVDRPALRSALHVLEQNGDIGIFPEGGIWQPGSMRTQNGVSWLSYWGNSPVLPFGFSGTVGALDHAIRFKRHTLTMKIGKIIPPVRQDLGKPRKIVYDTYSDRILQQVRDLILPNDLS